MTLVDAHHHLWDLTVRDQDWITGPELTPLRRNFDLQDYERAATGVTASVLVQTVTVAAETPEFLALAQDSPIVAGVVGWTDLTAPDIADTLASLKTMPGGSFLVGIRHQVQGETDPDWLVRPDVLRGLAAIADADLAYDLVVLPHQLPAARAATLAVPQLTFVLDHLGKPPVATGALEPWTKAVRSLAESPNTVCKLSGLVTEARWDSWTPTDLRPYADTVLDAFGPHRLMFGSDWPVCTLAASFEEVLDTARTLTAELTAPESEAIFSGTAVHTYRLNNV